METKTYFASSVPAAMDVARKELGPDAMLVASKPSPAQAKALGRLEVTFAYPPQQAAGVGPVAAAQPRPTQPAKAPNVPGNLASPFSALRSFTPGGARPLTPEREEGKAAPTASTNASNPPSHFAALRAMASNGTRQQSQELDDIRQQLQALRGLVDRNRASPVDPRGTGPDMGAANGVVAGMVAKLCGRGMEPELAGAIAAEASMLVGERGAVLVDVLSRRIPVAPFGQVYAGQTRTLAFTGPAGRGKTTSLVKIALQYGLSRRVPVKIYSAGEHGVGCQEQMARYATILGVPYQSFEGLDSLELALAGDGWKGLALIDTPGLSPVEFEGISCLGRFFSRNPSIERHLVLRADARSADMQHMMTRFAPLAPSRLLFTGVEEAIGLGAMVETLIRSGVPATFVGTGQGIPDDIEEFDVTKVARAVCGDSALAAAAA